MKRLRVHLPDGSAETLRMEWAHGTATVLRADPLVREDVDRWLRRGLIELVREADGTVVQRVTRQDDPFFLDRIAETLKAQFGYRAVVQDEPARNVNPVSVAIAAGAIFTMSNLTVDAQLGSRAVAKEHRLRGSETEANATGSGVAISATSLESRADFQVNRIASLPDKFAFRAAAS